MRRSMRGSTCSTPLLPTVRVRNGSARRSAARRDDVVIAHKWPSPFEETKHQPGSRHHIVRACEGSLRRLGTDYIDLYQMHRPDSLTPIDETLSALDDLVRSGKVRYIGSSNFAGWQIADADWTSRTNQWARMVSAQNSYSLVDRRRRERGHPGVPALRRRDAAVLSTREWAPDRQVQARRGRSRRLPARQGEPHGGRREPVPERPQLRQGRGAREGCRGGRRVAAPSRDGRTRRATSSRLRHRRRTSPEQIKANVAAGTWTPPADVLAAIDEATK